MTFAVFFSSCKPLFTFTFEAALRVFASTMHTAAAIVAGALVLVRARETRVRGFVPRLAAGEAPGQVVAFLALAPA